MQAGVVKLSDVIALVREEADMVQSQFVTDFAIVRFINNSYKELYDMITTAYGEDYYAAIPAYITTVANQDRYALPDGETSFTDQDNVPFVAEPFYKLLGLDFQIAPNSPQGYVTLKTFPFSERNRFAVPNFASFWGFTNMRYRLLGNDLWLTPLPAAGQKLRMWYVPRPHDLIFSRLGSSTISSSTILMADTDGAVVGMSITGPGILPNTVITTINAGSIVVSQALLATYSNASYTMFDYTTTIDGISGWEEYIIIDAAMKCLGKEESDVTLLAARKMAMLERIESVAINRDPGTAARTADVAGGVWGDGQGGSGSGYGGY